MRFRLFLVVIVLVSLSGLTLVSCEKDVDMEFAKFVEKHVSRIEPLEKEGNLAYWKAALTGSEKDFERYSRLQLELQKIYTNREEFEYVKKVKESGRLKDEKLRRIAEVLYLAYLGNQIDSLLLKQIVELSTQVENKFNVFRPEVDGKKLTTNDVYEVLRTEIDSGRRKKVWEASKEVGRVVEEDLLKLIKLRNEAARNIGFDNYYTMSLTLSEQSEDELVKLFDELDELTREPFLKLKEEIDRELARKYGISPEEMRPWHYQDPYFQEAPQIGDIDLDRFYRKKDLVKIATDFYASIGLDVSDIIDRSDLYEKEGKNPHAFCTNIDRNGDIRILANMRDDSYWMETILHELGHAVYDKYIDHSLPYLLRSYPHLCTTEASAMYFGRLSQDPLWMKEALGLSDEEVKTISGMIRKSLRMKQLVFARWCQTMFRFERELYRNPDQNLNKLWWDIVEKYQFVKRPEGRDEPDWATKIHIVSSPVYYHNYMLGEMIASQFHHYIVTELLGVDGDQVNIYGVSKVGDYFKNVVYKPGDIYPWNKHIEIVTGEPLTARYFVDQFVNEK